MMVGQRRPAGETCGTRFHTVSKGSNMFATGSEAGSLTIAKVRGIPIMVHWSAALIAVLFGLALAGNYGPAAAAVAVVAFFVSIVLHELGHALTAARFGVRTELVQLGALGGVARLDREAPSAKAEAWIAAAGPLVSIAVGVVAFGAFLGANATGLGGEFVAVVGWLGLINLLLAAFNLLPGAPLDGGRLVKAWRWQRTGDRFRAAREAAHAGRFLGWVVVALGVGMMVNGQGGLFIAFTGMFILLSAKAELMATDVAERLQGVLVRDLVWFGVASANGDTDADTMVWQRARLGGAGVVAIEQPGQGVVGLVDEDRLMATPEHLRPRVSLSSLMVPLRLVPRADLDEQLADVLPRLSMRAPFVTVWRDGKLLGVVPKRRLASRIEMAAGR
jgi:Zn-dependent protease